MMFRLPIEPDPSLLHVTSKTQNCICHFTILCLGGEVFYAQKKTHNQRRGFIQF
ncbi:hypothetical protein U27_01043 [Candidatus Vecturithrix granuli]|uniref:Uncharacterized protein n=1 Tax=Vecturithrix granuli TaxID=1499967 RepID=A0A081C990_VECG1|nr:hypothetical protein U27_01043 [Candidatus Vecturithrix granuli]